MKPAKTKRARRGVAFVDRDLVRDAVEHLRIARNLLVGLRSPKAADQVRRCLRSAEGAKRHIEGIHDRVFPPQHPFWRDYRPRLTVMERLHPMLDAHILPSPEQLQRPGHPRNPVCPQCGSDDFSMDASARWNLEDQRWELSNVFEDSGLCEHCEAQDFQPAWVYLNRLSAPGTSGYTTRDETTQERQQEILMTDSNRRLVKLLKCGDAYKFVDGKYGHAYRLVDGELHCAPLNVDDHIIDDWGPVDMERISIEERQELEQVIHQLQAN